MGPTSPQDGIGGKGEDWLRFQSFGSKRNAGHWRSRRDESGPIRGLISPGCRDGFSDFMQVGLLATLFHSHTVGQIGIFSNKGAQGRTDSTWSFKAGKEAVGGTLGDPVCVISGGERQSCKGSGEWGWVPVEVAEVVDCGCYWMIAGGGNGAGCRIRMVHGGEWCGVGFGGGGSGSRDLVDRILAILSDEQEYPVKAVVAGTSSISRQSWLHFDMSNLEASKGQKVSS
ncbi:hypothetical protein CK203_074235 [Vitis vinifera]|uniref:Uncharacterized protein n=1 Tax=Vitis vinifera TaxID=29760 RepID=A0A438DTE0_VITVI|nr:hypothetical protein CK203_074235 [Vitis vinifera]